MRSLFIYKDYFYHPIAIYKLKSITNAMDEGIRYYNCIGKCQVTKKQVDLSIGHLYLTKKQKDKLNQFNVKVSESGHF